MAAATEVGHVRNLSNFNTLISFVESYGYTYNPSKQKLQLPQLYTVSIIAQEMLTNVTIQKTAYSNAVKVRKEAFKGLQELSANVINALNLSNADTITIQNANKYNKKIQGQREVSDATIGLILLSYDQAVDLFANLIRIVESESSYAPINPELSVASLNTMHQWLTQQNTAKSLAFTAMKNVRIERNKVLYHPENGILAIAGDIKNYIQSVFGPSSKQFNEINKLKFKKPKR